MPSLQRPLPKAGHVRTAVGLLICAGGAAALLGQVSQLIR